MKSYVEGSRLVAGTGTPYGLDGAAKVGREGSYDHENSLRLDESQAVTRVIPGSSQAKKGGDRPWQPAP